MLLQAASSVNNQGPAPMSIDSAETKNPEKPTAQDNNANNAPVFMVVRCNKTPDNKIASARIMPEQTRLLTRDQADLLLFKHENIAEQQVEATRPFFSAQHGAECLWLGAKNLTIGSFVMAIVASRSALRNAAKVSKFIFKNASRFALSSVNFAMDTAAETANRWLGMDDIFENLDLDFDSLKI